MKRIISILLVFVIVCTTLVGCDFDEVLNWASSVFNVNQEPEIEWEEKHYWQGDINDDFLPGEVLVLLDKAISEVNKVHSKEFFGGVEIEEIIDLSYTTKPLPSGIVFRQTLHIILCEKTKEAVLEAIKIIEQIPGVVSAEPNLLWHVGSANPYDPFFSFEDNWKDQWALEKIDVEKVWDFTVGTSDVRIGVMDTGISYHNDLRNNYYIIDGTEDYNNALDFYASNTEDPIINIQDSYYHGTHVAGIIGAEGNNGEGISGVVWDVSLVQMRVGESTVFSTKAIVNALKWTTEAWDTDERVSVINFSAYSYQPTPTVETEIRNYCNKGGLLICCVGNDPQNNDTEGNHTYPSYYGSTLYGDNYVPNIISVGNTDFYDELTDGANWGDQSIDVFAPGDAILSTVPMDLCGDSYYECNVNIGLGHYEYGYHHFSGSSMSTPHVTGVAALLLSANPNLTAAQIENCIIHGANTITITTGDGETQNVKRLNAWGAFKYLIDNYPVFEKNIGYVDCTYSYEVDADAEYMNDNTSMMKFNVSNAGSYNFTVSANAPIEVKLYGKDLSEIATTQIKTNNDSTVEFNYALDETTYYVRTNYVNEESTGTINVFVECPLHVHEYTKYLNYDSSSHIEVCALCGKRGTETSPHVLKAGSTINYKGFCMHCGAVLYLLDDGYIGFMSLAKYSVNGSYILPNGIIVLVDEDVEAYLNGTLAFYDKNDLPQTQ